MINEVMEMVSALKALGTDGEVDMVNSSVQSAFSTLADIISEGYGLDIVKTYTFNIDGEELKVTTDEDDIIRDMNIQGYTDDFEYFIQEMINNI